MPPALEILSLDTATPQIRAPGTGDTYTAPRGLEITPEAGSKALTLTGGTQTTSQPVIDATQTWNAPAVNVTGASGDGTVATLTFAAQTTAFPLGSTIVVASVNPTAYNGTFVVTASTTTSVSYASTTTTTYVSGGTVQQSMQGIRLNVTDTASAQGSYLLDLKTGGENVFRVNTKAPGVTNSEAFRFDFGNQSLRAVSSVANFWNIEGSAQVSFTSGGTTGASIGNNGVRLGAASLLGWTNINGAGITGTNDIQLFRDAADTLAQRRSTNAQTFRLYNTFTDASNYERGKISWSSNVLQIGTEKLGSGTARALEFQTDGTTRLTIGATGGTTVTGTLSIGGTTTLAGSRGLIRTGLLNSFNFGIIGATGTRSIELFVDDTSGRGILIETGTGNVQFGGTTSSFPALKQSTTSLQARLADDSAFTNIQGKLTTETAYTAGAPTATGYIVLYDSTGTAYKVPAEAL